MQSSTQKKKVYRLAIVVSGEGLSELLTVTVILSETGKSKATAVYKTMKDYKLLY